ncbi:hypothetical protein SAMN06265348_109260 [Pedobacter westerhofensis]|uniref:Uncharacterized protein n=1 Tax=Pedobacter westerhofensis TaxID=425512 RepID=A0A521EWZ4_9SPHI|nr:hypothetical protein SAMN06265348_109260 [Pedobacter westerhofensis]
MRFLHYLFNQLNYIGTKPDHYKKLNILVNLINAI